MDKWLFPLSALEAVTSPAPLDKALYDLARGVEFLFRLGTSLKLYAFCESLNGSVTEIVIDLPQPCSPPLHGSIDSTCASPCQNFTGK